MNSMDAIGTDAARTAAIPKTIALMNQKGGVGKTTTTVNLGAAIAEAGKRVLLIDLDPQAHLTLHFGLELRDDARTIYDLLIDSKCRFEDVVTKNARDGLDIIPSETDVAGAEMELSSRPGREFILGNKLRNAINQYDIVMFDCPPSLGLLTLNALAMTAEVLVPMQAHFLPLQGVGKLLETVGMVCENVNPDLRVAGIILCAHEGNTTLSKEIVADLEAFFESSRNTDVAWRDCTILKPAIRRNIKLAEAPSFGQTIFDYEPLCNGAKDYRLLADTVLTKWFPEEVTLSNKVEQPMNEADIQVEREEESIETADEVAANQEMEIKPDTQCPQETETTSIVTEAEAVSESKYSSNTVRHKFIELHEGAD